jgi:hypothetical protein
MSDDRIDAQFPILVKEITGHTIHLLANFRFQVTGPHFAHLKERETIFDAVTDAEAAIRKLESDHQAELSMKVKLHLSIIDDEGHNQIADKINRSDSRISGVPTGIRNVYPSLAHVVEMVHRRNKLLSELNAIKKALDPLAIAAVRTYGGGRISVEELPDYNKRLADEYAAKLKLAKESIPEPKSNLKVVD